MASPPLLRHLNAICDSIKASKYTIVRAPPGSGKSTLVPIALAQNWPTVLMTTPRRSAAEALHRYFSKKNIATGLIMRGVRLGPKDSRFIIATEGAALYLNMNPAITIFDEVHELTDELYMLLATSMQKSGKFVLMSATMSIDGFMNYLGQCSVVDTDSSNEYHVEFKIGRPCKAEYSYTYLSIIKELVPVALEHGQTLVFLPGKHEIAKIQEQFDYVHPVVFHSQSHNLEAAMSAKTRLILATDAAETSITLPFVKCVIDSGLRKRHVFSNGCKGLKLDFITAFSYVYRMGRVGRTSDGFYFAAFDNSVFVKIKANSLVPSPDPFKMTVFIAENYRNAADFLHPCELSDMCLQVDKMLALGMIASPERGLLTSYARQLLKLSFLGSFERISMVAEACKLGSDVCRFAAAAAALLSVKEDINFNYFRYPTQKAFNDFLQLARLASYCSERDEDFYATYQYICTILDMDVRICAASSNLELTFLKVVRVAYEKQMAHFVLNWYAAGRTARISLKSYLSRTPPERSLIYESLFITNDVVEMVCVMNGDDD